MTPRPDPLQRPWPGLRAFAGGAAEGLGSAGLMPAAAGGHAGGAGRQGLIGPNAITRVAEVLPPRVGSAATWALFDSVGLVHHLRQPPQHMVDEEEVRRLHGALREQLGWDRAGAVARDAGLRTADYLLAHRIPRPVQAVLKKLPARLAARVLLAAISRHAWTFAGSGRFQAHAPLRAGAPVVLRIQDNPLCRGVRAQAPACDYYAAVFQRLFQVLVHRASRVHEVACEACGDAECRFEIAW
jgi:divinyl protochlorophyllide a 8-vinyl-reductase